MISTILALLGPKVIGIMALVLAALGWGFQQRLAGAKAERIKQKAKEADAYESHLKDIADASVARPSGSVSDDPNNRDR